MTVNTVNIVSGPYLGNGTSDTFSYTFRIDLNTQLEVWERSVAGVWTLLTLTTDYTVAGVGNDAGGTITLVAGNLASGKKLYIRSNYQATQLTDFESQGAFFPDIHEAAMDKMTFLIQQLQDQADRSFRLSPFFDIDGTLEIDSEAADRAEAYLQFDASGNLTLVNQIDPTTISFPVQTNKEDKFLQTDGSILSWADSIPMYDTVAAMKAASPKIGSWVGTKGYYTIGDSGHALYRVAASAAVDGYGDHTLANSNIAVLQRGNSAIALQFGVLFDNSTDNTSALLAAINSADTIILGSGIALSSTLSLTSISNKTIIGLSRQSSIIKTLNSVNDNLFALVNCSNIEFKSLTIDGNSANNPTVGNGLLISGTSNRITFNDCRITGARQAGVAATNGTSIIKAFNCRIDNNVFDGFQMTQVSRSTLMFCEVDNNGRYGAVYGSACTDVTEHLNDFHDNAQGGSVMVGGSNAIRVGNLADTNGTGHGLQYNNVDYGLYVGNLSHGNGISGLDFTLGSQYGVVVGNITYGNTVRGIEIDSQSHYGIALGNQANGNGDFGLTAFSCVGGLYLGNQAIANQTSGIELFDDGVNPNSGNIVMGNNCSDPGGGGAVQNYGIRITGTASPSLQTVGWNRLEGNVTAGWSFLNNSVPNLANNIGFLSRNQGGGAIASGTTSVVVTHGLAVTPATKDITVMPSNGSTNDVGGPLWITNITSTQFTVNCRLDPGAGGLNFEWKAEVEAV